MSKDKSAKDEKVKTQKHEFKDNARKVTAGETKSLKVTSEQKPPVRPKKGS